MNGDTTGGLPEMTGLDGDVVAAAAAVAVVAGGEEVQAAESELAWEQVPPVRDVFDGVQNGETAHDHVRPMERSQQQGLRA